jgi:RNA polymerase sigma factor (sigma-70 family)
VYSKTGNNLTDRHIIASILKGDATAFGSIIKNTEALVAQIVFKMIANAEDRKDMAQDIYLKAFHHLPGFRFQSKLSTWVARIAYNTCLSYLRKKKLLFPGGAQDKDGTGEEELEMLSNRALNDPGSGTEQLIFQKELSGVLQTAINGLPPVYKTLITLFHYEELSYEEIGQITGLPEGTLKSYLFRARKTLKENLLAKIQKGGIMTIGHPSEMELQQYALDNSTCSSENMQHIEACENCQAQTAAYRLLYAAIKEQPSPVFDFDLSGLILAQLPGKQAEQSILLLSHLATPVPVGRTRVSGFSLTAWLLVLLSMGMFGITLYLFRKNIWNVFRGISVFFIYSILAAASLFVLFRTMRMYRKFLRQMEALNF